MKRALKRVIGKSINMFNHMKKIGERLLKIIVQSAVVCCPAILILIIINTILGVNIRFNYYLMLAVLVTLASSFIVSIFKWEQITAKPVKITKTTVPAKTNRKTQRNIHRKRRKVS